MSFYKQDTPNCKEYLCYDIPAIANDFANLIWPDVRMNGGVTKLCRRSFGATDLDMLEGEFRMIMVVSNAIEGGKLDVVGLQLRPGSGSNTRSNRVRTISNVLTRDPPNNQSVTDAEVEVSLSGTDLISPPGSRRSSYADSRRSSYASGSSTASTTVPDSLRLENLTNVQQMEAWSSGIR